jgi:streptolysin S family bacteriocin protoxin
MATRLTLRHPYGASLSFLPCKFMCMNTKLSLRISAVHETLSAAEQQQCTTARPSQCCCCCCCCCYSMGHDAKTRNMRVPDIAPKQFRQSRQGCLPCCTLPTNVLPGATIQVVQWIITKEANLHVRSGQPSLPMLFRHAYYNKYAS